MKFSFTNLTGFALGGGLSLVLLAGCTGSPPWGSTSKHPTTAQIQAMLGRLDNYVYFPAYEIYYNRTKDHYIFWSDRAWVTRNKPPGDVAVEVLLGSPAVAMNFNDAPARHHEAVVRTYPRNWGRSEAVMASVH